MKSNKKIESYLDYLYKVDYKERPVSVKQFLSDERFFGKLTDGGKSIYPIWMEKMTEFLAEDSKYLGVFTGAIGCLAPDVRVSLLDGRELTIPEIIEERKKGKQHWVYSYDIENDKLVPGKVVDALMSGHSNSLVEVTIDNDNKIVCTDNHPFLLSSGIYKEAKDLKSGDSLMSLCGRTCAGKLRAIKSKEKKDIVVQNHKVVCVKKLNGKKGVYDLSIEDYHNFALTDGVFVHNTGKTRNAVWAAGYVMYKLLCLRNPWKFFNLAAGGKMSVAFFNLTKSLSESRAFNILQQHLLASEWFRKRGIVAGKPPNQRLEFPLFDYALASPYSSGFGTQGRDIIIAIMDEVDSPTASEKQKQRVLAAYESTVRRFESRFVDDTYNETLGKFLLVASKQEQYSFLDAFITEHKDSKNTYIADIKYWEIKPEGTYSGKTFPVMLGDMYNPSRILCTEQEVKDARSNGYQILDVPVEFQESFERDLVGALRDIGGVSAVSLRRTKLFPSEKSLYDCYDETKPDPANITTIEIGLRDELDLIKFIDLNKIRTPKHLKRFIHCDIAYSGDGDALSVAMSCVKDWVKKDVENADGSFSTHKVPVVETDFVIRLKGRPGDEIPMYRVRKFILDLRAAGYTLHFSADLALLSTDTKQILTRSGIECSYLSLDRDVKPYLMFRELVFDQRWVCHKNNILHFELANLEYDKEKQKIDHPHKVETLEFLEDGDTRELVVLGSKDCSDATAGSVFKAVESSPAVPMDASVVKTLSSAMRSASYEVNTFDWLVGKTVKESRVEQYMLQDKEGKYWVWTKENAALPPELKGPFDEKLVNLPVVEVDNPAQFSPENKFNKVSSEHQSKVNILRIASGR